MHLSIAGPADAAQITALINEAFRVERFFIDGDRIDQDTVRGLLASGTFLLACDDDGVPAGCVHLEPRGERLYLGLLSVDRRLRRGGVGSQLMAAAEAHALAAGCRAIDLRIVNVRQGLADFYRRRGYVETGAISHFPPGTPLKIPCHFIEMSKSLTTPLTSPPATPPPVT